MERLQQIIDHIGLSVRAFAVGAGLDPSNVGKMLRDAIPLTDKTAQKIEKAYNISASWLMKGEGDMLVEGSDVVKSQDVGIPLLDGEQVRAGALSGYGQPLSPVDTIRLPELRWRDGDFAVRANGRSMIDPTRPEQSIPDGAIVVLRPWLDRNIHWGEMYCIYTQEGYAIKRVMKGDDEQHIKCVSNNEAEGYEPYQVERDSILGIARVTAIISVKTLWA